jgi:hypothetical protein
MQRSKSPARPAGALALQPLTPSEEDDDENDGANQIFPSSFTDQLQLFGEGMDRTRGNTWAAGVGFATFSSTLYTYSEKISAMLRSYYPKDKIDPAESIPWTEVVINLEQDEAPAGLSAELLEGKEKVKLLGNETGMFTEIASGRIPLDAPPGIDYKPITEAIKNGYIHLDDTARLHVELQGGGGATNNVYMNQSIPFSGIQNFSTGLPNAARGPLAAQIWATAGIRDTVLAGALAHRLIDAPTLDPTNVMKTLKYMSDCAVELSKLPDKTGKHVDDVWLEAWNDKRKVLGKATRDYQNLCKATLFDRRDVVSGQDVYKAQYDAFKNGCSSNPTFHLDHTLMQYAAILSKAPEDLGKAFDAVSKWERNTYNHAGRSDNSATFTAATTTIVPGAADGAINALLGEESAEFRKERQISLSVMKQLADLATSAKKQFDNTIAGTESDSAPPTVAPPTVPTAAGIRSVIKELQKNGANLTIATDTVKRHLFCNVTAGAAVDWFGKRMAAECDLISALPSLTVAQIDGLKKNDLVDYVTAHVIELVNNWAYGPLKDVVGYIAEQFGFDPGPMMAAVLAAAGVYAFVRFYPFLAGLLSSDPKIPRLERHLDNNYYCESCGSNPASTIENGYQYYPHNTAKLHRTCAGYKRIYKREIKDPDVFPKFLECAEPRLREFIENPDKQTAGILMTELELVDETPASIRTKINCVVFYTAVMGLTLIITKMLSSDGPSQTSPTA